MNGRRGAPKGNQNARKHGFYSQVLDEAERLDFERATKVEGLDEEIALIRVKIKSLVEHNPENVKLIGQAVRILVGLVRAKYSISKDDKGGIKKAVGNVLKNVGLPLGLSIFDKLVK